MKSTYLLLIFFLVATACKISKKPDSSSEHLLKQKVLDEIVVKSTDNNATKIYNQSETRKTDLLHTRLDLSFDYKNQFVLGKATLLLKPYFHKINQTTLDAKGFEIIRLALIKSGDTTDLKYQYDQNKLNIFLGKFYNRLDTFTIFIDYIAKPSLLKTKGSSVISDNRGLYFINPMMETPNKPRQIWTQGETESNSGWFPTIDAPNEKHTQEIFLTVDQNDVTLSNGELIYSNYNVDGTRTDYWSLKLPHAPYLTMIAVGNFAVVKDKWRDTVDLFYYVEPEFKNTAKITFGRTPEILEFFSKKLGVTYPWPKLAQIVTRDFVSGGMENTGAIVYYDALNQDLRDTYDRDFDDIISHEIFHQWFGDLVTCESWSNLPLNESFATYGTYLWNEHKKGKFIADFDIDNDLKAYLSSPGSYKKEPIRYCYKSRDDMFDVVSYQKGGLILHSLRNYLGDEVFFETLNVYLKKYSFNTTEIHNLRMAFEEVSGEDLNWFFNQWFLKAGHPKLEVNYRFSANLKVVEIEARQMQDSSLGVYKLPLSVQIYSNSGSRKEKILIDKKLNKFTFQHFEPINLITFDADNILIGSLKENKSDSMYFSQLELSTSSIDKKRAFEHIEMGLSAKPNIAQTNAINYCLNHYYWGVIDWGLSMLSRLELPEMDKFTTKLIELSSYQQNSGIRSSAIDLLSAIDAKKHFDIFKNALKDSSYQVVSSAIDAISIANSDSAIIYCEALENIKNDGVRRSIASIYEDYTKSNKNDFYISHFAKHGYYSLGILNSYVVYLSNNNEEIMADAISKIKPLWTDEKVMGKRRTVQNFVSKEAAILENKLNEELSKNAKSKKDNPKSNSNDFELIRLNSLLTKWKYAFREN